MDIQKRINVAIERYSKAIKSLAEQGEVIDVVAQKCIDAIINGNKLILAGNGGSAADAQHAAAELIGKLGLGRQRRPLPAIALNVDTSVITALANDFGYYEVFAKQIQALGQEGDVFIALSTSGTSPNILRAVEIARDLGIVIIAMSGPYETPLSEKADNTIHIEGSDTPSIQTGHGIALHILCELIESRF